MFQLSCGFAFLSTFVVQILHRKRRILTLYQANKAISDTVQ